MVLSVEDETLRIQFDGYLGNRLRADGEFGRSSAAFIIVSLSDGSLYDVGVCICGHIARIFIVAGTLLFIFKAFFAFARIATFFDARGVGCFSVYPSLDFHNRINLCLYDCKFCGGFIFILTGTRDGDFRSRIIFLRHIGVVGIPLHRIVVSRQYRPVREFDLCDCWLDFLSRVWILILIQSNIRASYACPCFEVDIDFILILLVCHLKGKFGITCQAAG